MLGSLLGDGRGFLDLSAGGVPIRAGFDEKSLFILDPPSFLLVGVGDPVRLADDDEAGIGDSLETVMPGADDDGAALSPVPDLLRLCDNMADCPPPIF